MTDSGQDRVHVVRGVDDRAFEYVAAPRRCCQRPGAAVKGERAGRDEMVQGRASMPIFSEPPWTRIGNRRFRDRPGLGGWKRRPQVTLAGAGGHRAGAVRRGRSRGFRGLGQQGKPCSSGCHCPWWPRIRWATGQPRRRAAWSPPGRRECRASLPTMTRRMPNGPSSHASPRHRASTAAQATMNPAHVGSGGWLGRDGHDDAERCRVMCRATARAVDCGGGDDRVHEVTGGHVEQRRCPGRLPCRWR